MRKKPEWIRRLQSGTDEAKESTRRAAEGLKRRTAALDGKFGLTGAVKRGASAIAEGTRAVDERLGLSTAAGQATAKLSTGLRATRKSEAYGKLEDATRGVVSKTRVSLLNPASDYLESKGVHETLRNAGVTASRLYGRSRSLLKPYFAPETPRELLETTRDELLYINACILQISRDEAEKLANRFGTAIASKIAGAASAGALLGIASTFGTASTGTAISTLYGAAHINASLAWVGGVFGGGMAAGAVVTGGTALVVGAAVYKLLSSTARQFEDLTETERRIVETSAFLIAALNDQLEDPDLVLAIEDAEALYRNALVPVYDLVTGHADEICESLDARNATAFRQHALIDFQRSVLDGFKFYLDEETRKRRGRHPEFAIAGVVYALLTSSAIDDSGESQMALDAIRRVRKNWHDASESELSQALSGYTPEQLQGLANNAKGIYHEMLFIRDYNDSHTDTYAEMHAATNHAGSDVVIRMIDSGEIIDEYQLKATGGDQIVREHFEKYPDIDVMTTSELASRFPGVGNSGISNEEITGKMDAIMTDVVDNTVMDRAEESAMIGGLTGIILESRRLMDGHSTAGEAGVRVATTMGVTAGSTALASLLFAS